MKEKILIKELLDKYILELQDVAKNVEIHKIATLDMVISKHEAVLNKINDLVDDKNIIYIIKTNEDFPIKEIEKIKENLKKDGYAVFRINKDNIKNYVGVNSDKYLYVGSSKEVKKRLKEHLGFGYKSTFSLHLNKWFENKKIQIELYKVANDKNLQLFEDLLWENYKPFLGRQGRK